MMETVLKRNAIVQCVCLYCSLSIEHLEHYCISCYFANSLQHVDMRFGMTIICISEGPEVREQ